jgi:hypothetical protein
MDHLGQDFDLFSAQDGTKVAIQMKPYLQPFEEFLGLRELEGLCDSQKIEKSIDGYSISVPKAFENLKS